MALPQADKVRTAEIAEYGSHVQNGTFGPALEPGEFTPGMALTAVWVYSRSKKEPGAFKARLVMQGFLMQQGLHFNDVHAPVPAVTSFSIHARSCPAREDIGSLGRQDRILNHAYGLSGGCHLPAIRRRVCNPRLGGEPPSIGS